VATIAAALNNPEQSSIGDPREGIYKVSLRATDLTAAVEIAKNLATLGITPLTSVIHDAAGQPAEAYVNIHKKAAQRSLLERTESRLNAERRKQLEDLVLARGPIPDDILGRIAASAECGQSPAETARRMNELGVIAGMGGKRWTAQKVKAALAQYRQMQEAV
jgi:hypothetical protein